MEHSVHCLHRPTDTVVHAPRRRAPNAFQISKKRLPSAQPFPPAECQNSSAECISYPPLSLQTFGHIGTPMGLDIAVPPAFTGPAALRLLSRLTPLPPASAANPGDNAASRTALRPTCLFAITYPIPVPTFLSQTAAKLGTRAQPTRSRTYTMSRRTPLHPCPRPATLPSSRQHRSPSRFPCS